MPRRSVLCAAERDSLLALPATQDELIRHYTFIDNDLALICQCRGNANRLGFAVRMGLLRYRDQGLGVDCAVKAPVLRWIAHQLPIEAVCWTKYAER